MPADVSVSLISFIIKTNRSKLQFVFFSDAELMSFASFVFYRFVLSFVFVLVWVSSCFV